MIRGYRSGRRSAAGTLGESGQIDRRFFEYAEHVAEQGRCTEPPFAFGTDALEFGTLTSQGSAVGEL